MTITAAPPAPPSGAESPIYAGLVTRTVGFVIDAAIVNGIVVVTVAAAALALSMFGVSLDSLPDTVTAAIGIGFWALVGLLYFVGSWTLTGQTLGMRVMGVRVQRTGGGHLSVWRGAVRLAGMFVSALLLFTGFLIIPFDRRCRGLHDRIARTVVVFVPPDEAATIRPMRRIVNAERARLAGGAQGAIAGPRTPGR